MIRIGLPKGRMAPASERFCDALGIQIGPGILRYRTAVGGLDISVLLLKAPDVARLLRRNLLEPGVVGHEWLMETGTRTDHRCFDTRSYSVSVCLLTADNDRRPTRLIRSVVTPYPNPASRLLRQTMPGFGNHGGQRQDQVHGPGQGDHQVDIAAGGRLNDWVVSQYTPWQGERCELGARRR